MDNPNPNPYFNSYLTCNHLLIQFILTEFIRTHALARHLKYLSTHFSTSPQSFKELIPQVAHDLIFLMGTTHDNSRPWASHWRSGSLSKLNNYTEHLTSNSLHQNKTFYHMHEEFFRAWVSCLRCYEIVKTAQRSTSPFTTTAESPLILPLSRGLLAFDSSLITAGKLLLKAVRQFSENENVLLFLLRRKEDLSALFGANNISELVSGNAPLLKRNYAERGFENILNTLCQV